MKRILLSIIFNCLIVGQLVAQTPDATKQTGSHPSLQMTHVDSMLVGRIAGPGRDCKILNQSEGTIWKSYLMSILVVITLQQSR